MCLRIGYKRFVYGGWGTRVLFIFGMALVPLTGFCLEGKSRLALLLMLLFCFNLSRAFPVAPGCPGSRRWCRPPCAASILLVMPPAQTWRAL